MSLIRAARIEDNVIIVSDTKLTSSTNSIDSFRDNQLHSGTIKVNVLRDDLCVCFAGSTFRLDSIYNQIVDDYCLENVHALLLDFNKQSLMNENETEFIVVSISNKPRIVCIKNGELNEMEQAWIGDSKAFSMYQKAFHENLTNRYTDETVFNLVQIPFEGNVEIGNLYSKMINAMNYVIEDETIDTVGGFTIPVIWEKEKFSIPSYIRTYRKSIGPDELGNGDWIPVSFGGAKDGSYTVNFFSSENLSIGVHIYQGNYGIIFNKDKTEYKIEVFSDFDEMEFNDYLILNTEMKLHSTIIHSPQNLYIKARRSFEESPYKSIRFLERALDYKINEIKKREQVAINNIDELLVLDISKEDSTFIAKCLNDKGVMHQKTDKSVEAIECFRKAMLFDENTDMYRTNYDKMSQ